MIRILIFSINCLFVLTLSESCKKNSGLLFVQILFRHGERAPLKLYPNDPNPESFWKEGLESLTVLGRKQHYALGKYLKHMYGNFITSDPKEIKVLSSDIDRCLQSAESNVASFFAPSPEWQLEEDLNWQPIPIRYITKDEDKFLRIDNNCPRATVELDRVLNSPECQADLAKHKVMFEYLTNNSGTPITELRSAFHLHDALSLEKKHNLSIPEWATRYWDELEHVNDMLFFWFFKSPLIHRLQAGPILGKIIELMNGKIAGEIPSQKIQMYSTHDTTISAVLSALKVFNMKQPPFCATLLFELHKMADCRLALRLLYLNSSTPETGTQTPHVITLEGCSEFCPFDHFVNSTKSLIPEDWEKECQLSKSYIEDLKESSVAIGLFSSILLALITVMSVYRVWNGMRTSRKVKKVFATSHCLSY